jgi:hypothetical protein
MRFTACGILSCCSCCDVVDLGGQTCALCGVGCLTVKQNVCTVKRKLLESQARCVHCVEEVA